jgi:CMP-N-acetylneuraminic acid synthetase
MIQPSLVQDTTIYFIIINLYAVFKMERYFICDIDNKKEWQHFKLKRCHSVGTA